jgi:hypothetical protein
MASSQAAPARRKCDAPAGSELRPDLMQYTRTTHKANSIAHNTHLRAAREHCDYANTVTTLGPGAAHRIACADREYCAGSPASTHARPAGLSSHFMPVFDLTVHTSTRCFCAMSKSRSPESRPCRIASAHGGLDIRWERQ